jgi:hypothetical protein
LAAVAAGGIAASVANNQAASIKSQTNTNFKEREMFKTLRSRFEHFCFGDLDLFDA